MLLDSFWRALANMFRLRVLALSVLPLAIMATIAGALRYFYWDSAVAYVSQWITNSGWMGWFWNWLSQLGSGSLAALFAPLLVVATVVPLIVVGSLFGVAAFMTPTLVKLVAKDRFATLELKHGASFVRSAVWSLGSAAMAFFALTVSSPLWLVPPFIFILPPLIWGWLTYRVMAFDALADHASQPEREAVLRKHKLPLLIIGLITGYLGAAPAIVWASGVVFAAAFFILIPLGIWIYTMVFALSSLWFAHYCLHALEKLRSQEAGMANSDQRSDLHSTGRSMRRRRLKVSGPSPSES